MTNHTHTNIYKVSVVMKMKLTSMLPLSRLKLVHNTPPPPPHARTHTRMCICVYTHTQTGARTGTNRRACERTCARAHTKICLITFYVRLVVDKVDVCVVIYVRFGPYLYVILLVAWPKCSVVNVLLYIYESNFV